MSDVVSARVASGRSAVPLVRRMKHRLSAGLEAARNRCVDLLPDLAERFAGPTVGRVLPPARLRRRVARGSSRDEYLKAGGLAVAEILGFLGRADWRPEQAGRWLDFGCGCGRLSWILIAAGVCERLTGVDVDEEAIEWCRNRLPEGDFVAIRPRPPLPFEDSSFDLVVAASVFTHFDEPDQEAWLDELARVLAPGGHLLASTHAPGLVELRPELGAAARRRLDEEGFLFAAGDGAFNDGAAFHHPEYLARVWGRQFIERRSEGAALYGLQDLALWQRRS